MAKKMIGLSLSLCIRDILNGVYSIHDVVKIITGTRICTMEDFDHVCGDDKGYGAHYWQADPAAARRIFMNLLLLGKIDQPRLRDEATPNLQGGHWLDTDPAAIPGDDIKENLAAIWAKLLKIEASQY